MFRNTYPVFEAKRLLKKEMLDNLRDFPREWFDLRYRDYSDGVLSGCDIRGTDTGFTVLPGILYYKKIPYFLDKPYAVSYKAEGELVYVKVHFWDKAVGAGGEEFFSQVTVDNQEPDAGQELELARFKLQTGARLRSEYVDFYDYETEFDTVNRIHVPYAAPGHAGIWPRICKSFAARLLKSPGANAWDIAFGLRCLELKEAMSYEAVRAYLNARLRRDGEYTNAQIYSAFKGILREAGGRGEAPERTGRKEGTLLML